jgi:predicted metalloprotease with PDZ domain
LNAVSRAYDGYKSKRGAQDVPLVEASNRRWALPPSLIYDRGLLIAFLLDLTLLQQSGGRNGVEDVYRTLFRRHNSSAGREEGNTVVIRDLKGRAGAGRIVERYVEDVVTLDMPSEVERFG